MNSIPDSVPQPEPKDSTTEAAPSGGDAPATPTPTPGAPATTPDLDKSAAVAAPSTVKPIVKTNATTGTGQPRKPRGASAPAPTAPTEVPPKYLLLDPSLAEWLHRMELWFGRLTCPPLEMVREILEYSGATIAEISSLWLLDPTVDLAHLRQKKAEVDAQFALLEKIELSGKVQLKFSLSPEEMTTLTTHAATLTALFGIEFHPRDVLKILWSRGGILHVAAFAKRSGK
jgi:hypothetical protein